MTPDDRELLMLVARIDAKLDMALQRQDQQDARIDEVSKRVTHLEKARAWLLGGVAAIVFTVNVLLKYIGNNFL